MVVIIDLTVVTGVGEEAGGGAIWQVCEPHALLHPLHHQGCPLSNQAISFTPTFALLARAMRMRAMRTMTDDIIHRCLHCHHPHSPSKEAKHEDEGDSWVRERGAWARVMWVRVSGWWVRARARASGR